MYRRPVGPAGRCDGLFTTFGEVNHAEVAAAYLTPLAVDVVEPKVPDTPARRLRDVLEPIATIGWWSSAAGEQFADAGLDFLGGYVWGRAASLGPDVAADVVAAAFGVFEPSLFASGIETARQIAPHEEVLARRAVGATEGLVAATSGISATDVEHCARRLRAALDGVDVTARPLFSALRALPTPDDPHGALWRAAEMYREHRGDGHLAACVAAGLDAVEMNVVTEVWLGYPVGEYSATRGFGPDRLEHAVQSLAARGWLAVDLRELTAQGRAAREEIEAATDASQQAVIEALGEELEPLIQDLSGISRAVITACAAPADPRKRAAG